MGFKGVLDKLLGKKSTKPGLVGISFAQSEMALAYVLPGDGQPSLELCEICNLEYRHDPAESLRQEVSRLGLEDTRCCVVLPRNDYKILLVEAPQVEESELVSAIRWRVKDLVDEDVEDLAISVFRVPEDAYRNRAPMVYVVTAPKTRIATIVDQVNESGLVLEAIDIPELAMKNLASAFTSDEHGLAFIDIGPNGGVMNLSRDGAVYLTRQLNTGLQDETLEGVNWESLRDRLVLEIQRSLDYYESQMGHSQIQRLLIAPRQVDTDKLVQELDQAMAVGVEGMNLAKVLTARQELTFPVQQSCLLAIGAALREEAV